MQNLPSDLMLQKNRWGGGETKTAALHRYTPEQLYSVVADVDQYQRFVPWCTKSRVFKGQSGDFRAELEIGFPPVVERYTSEVTVVPNHKVRVSLWEPALSAGVVSQRGEV